MEPRIGIEPTTSALQMLRSTFNLSYRGTYVTIADILELSQYYGFGDEKLISLFRIVTPNQERSVFSCFLIPLIEGPFVP